MTQDSEPPPHGTEAGSARPRYSTAQSILIACLLGAIILLIAFAAFSTH